MNEDDMPTIIDFSEDISTAEAPPALPPGDYTAEIKSARVRVGATSERRYVEVMFHIPTDQYPADYDVENKPDGINIAFRRVPAEDDATSRYRMRMFCEAIGVTPSRKIDVSEFVGCEARVTTFNERNEGVEREQISKVVSAD